MRTPNRKWKKTSSVGELNLYSLLAAAATNIISFERSIGRLWDTVRVIMGTANQLTSDAKYHSSTRKQQWNTRSVRKVEKIFSQAWDHLCFDQLHTRHNLQIVGQLSLHAINLWRLGLVPNAPSWFHWKSLGSSSAASKDQKFLQLAPPS